MSNNVPFTALVRLVSDGDPVDADHTNQAPTDLTQRTTYLKNVLDTLESGQLLTVTGATLQAALPVGTPMYLDTDNVLKPAVVALAVDAVGGAASKTAYVFGLLLAKDTDTSGSAAIVGRITTLSQSDWANVIDGGVWAAGHYFLSAENAGKISTAPGSLAVYVGQMLPDATFLLRAAPPTYGSHTHYQFDLLGKPAGTVVDPAVGVDQTISVPDATQRGWLPATAPYFPTEQIPAGAKFGYNLAHASEAALRAVFPPVPLSGATFDQGGLTLDDDVVTVNEFGIWWNLQTYGNAPWPVDYAATSIAEDVIFWFSRLLFATDTGVVTSLQKDPASLLDIQVVNASGQAATAGKLRLLVSSLLPSSSTTNEAATAVKTISGGTHTTGPVASRLIPGAGIAMTAAQGDGILGYYGAVTVSASNSDALQGSATLVNIQNARQDTVSDLIMVSLPVGRDSSPVFQIEISKLAPPVSGLRLRPWLYSSTTGTTPAVTAQYRIIPATSANTVIPTGWSTLGTGLGALAVTSGQMRQLDLTPDIANVPAGAVVLVRFVRLGSTDGFSGTIGIPRLDFALV